MEKRRKLRIISGVMFIILVIFLICVLYSPLGKAIYLKCYRVVGYCNIVYVIAMIALFVSSFFVRKAAIEPNLEEISATSLKVNIARMDEQKVYGLWKKSNDKTISNDIKAFQKSIMPR